jgi:hypothetical protein
VVGEKQDWFVCLGGGGCGIELKVWGCILVAGVYFIKVYIQWVVVWGLLFIGSHSLRGSYLLELVFIGVSIYWG